MLCLKSFYFSLSSKTLFDQALSQIGNVNHVATNVKKRKCHPASLTELSLFLAMTENYRRWHIIGTIVLRWEEQTSRVPVNYIINPRHMCKGYNTKVCVLHPPHCQEC